MGWSLDGEGTGLSLARSTEDLFKDGHYAALYTDEEWFDQYRRQERLQRLSELPDFDEMTRGMLNRAFLSEAFGWSLEQVDATYPVARDVFSLEVLGKPVETEKEFATKLKPLFRPALAVGLGGFATTPEGVEFGARVVRGSVVGAETARTGFYAMIEGALRGERNPYVGKTVEEARADIPDLQRRIAGGELAPLNRPELG